MLLAWCFTKGIIYHYFSHRTLKIYKTDVNCARGLVMLYQVKTRERYSYEYVCGAHPWVLDIEFELTV